MDQKAHQIGQIQYSEGVSSAAAAGAPGGRSAVSRHPLGEEEQSTVSRQHNADALKRGTDEVCHQASQACLLLGGELQAEKNLPGGHCHNHEADESAWLLIQQAVPKKRYPCQGRGFEQNMVIHAHKIL